MAADFWADLEEPKQGKGDFWAGLDQPRTTEAMPVEYGGTAPLPMDPASRMARVQQTFQEKQAAAKAAEPGFFEKLKQAGQAGVEDLGRTLLSTYRALDPTQATSALEAGAAPVMAGILGTPPGAASVVAGEATRKAAELSGMPPWLQAAAGTTASIAVPGGAIPRRVIGGLARPAPAPARPIQEIIPPARPPERLALPEPANMVMEAGPEGITRAPQRNIIDLVDEIKKDVKATVIDDIFEELRTGRTAAMPRREAPAQIAAPRRMLAEIEAKTQVAPEVTPTTPIELPPPERPKIVMGKQGYRGAPETPAPMREPGPPITEQLGLEAPTQKDTWFFADPVKGGHVEKPVVYVRFGEAPQGPSANYMTAGKEVGVSVYPAYLDEQSGKYVLASGGEQYLATQEAISGQKRGVNIVKGRRITETGDDGEPLLAAGTIKKTKAISLDDLVSESEPSLTLAGNEIETISPPKPQPTIQDLLAKAQAKADKSIEKLGIGQRKQAAKVMPEEPPFEIPPEVQKETPQVAPGATFTRQAIPEAAPAPEAAAAEEYINRLPNRPRPELTPAETARQEASSKRMLEEKYRFATPEVQRQHGINPKTGLIEEPVPKRTPLDILKEETGALRLPTREDPMAALRPEHEMGSTELARKSITQRVSKTLADMGPTGKKLGEDLSDAYFAGEQRRAKLNVEIDKIFDKYPGVEDTLVQRLNTGTKGTAQEVAAYKEIKALTDAVGDEATQLKIKVKNPITGVERPFQKRQQYAPQLIDPAKVAKNPTRMVDAIMEELIADGMEPGKARTQATMMVRNMNKKSGSLQFMRTGKFDPDIHLTNAREAYKRALGGEVERMEVLKRFGKTDAEGLLGDEIGGIRERTANISAEAGPEAAQKAELWATRQIGMQRGEIDTIQKKAGELLRNFNTLKLGFMPVTNLAAQMPQILAAGKTTRFNPIKSLELIGKSFGKSGEGAELAKIFGTAMDNTSADLLQKFELSRGGPGGKAAAAFLHFTGGTKSENFIAKLAAQVGNEEAKYIIQKLIDNPGSKSAEKAITRYGLDPAKVLQEGATEENVFRIGRKFSDEVLLRGNVLDLPGAFTSESGKVLLQFKRATQILGQQMYDAAKNDPAKLVALVAASQIGGEALEDIKAGTRGTVAALLSGDAGQITKELGRRPEGVRRILNNWAAAISFGYMGDTVMDLLSGRDPKTLISGATVAASPVESAMHIAQGAGKIVTGQKGGEKQLVGGVLRELPGGTFLRALTRPEPPARAEKSERAKLLEELGLEHVAPSRQQMLKELGIGR